MDCPLSTSLLPGIWVIETLARSNQIDVSLLLDLLEKFPQTSDDLGKNARELVSFRILESFLFQGAQTKSPSSSSSPIIVFDQSESCEDVLQRILLETPASNLKAAGAEIWKWDVQSFIALKRSTLDRHALLQLKDAILTGRHSFPAYLKERSGLPFRNQPGSGFVVNGGKPDGIMHRFEQTDSNPCLSEANNICPAVANSSYLMHCDKPNGNLSPVKQKGYSTIEISRGKSGKDQIVSKDGSEGHKELSKKYENDIIHCEQDLGGKLSSSVVTRHSVDTSMMIGQCSEIERCTLERSTNFRETGTDGPLEDDSNECTSLKDIGGANKLLHSKNLAPHCDTEMPNDRSGDEHAQKIEIRETKGDKEGLCGLRSSENVDRFEPYIKDRVQNDIGEGKNQDLHCDIELPNDRYDHEHGQNVIREAKNDKVSFCDRKSTEEKDKFEPHSKDDVQSEREEGIHIDCDGLCKYSRYCAATKCSDLNLLADVCAGVDEVSQVLGYSLGNRTCLGSIGQKGPPGDVELTSSKGLLGMHHKEQVCNHNTKNVTDLGDAEDVVVFGESDGCLDERTDIATKKNAFLSSQCSFSQGSVDCRELNVCVKCNKGGKLMVCSTSSCRLVVHESCLGSHVSFSTGKEFHCPFCAYSQAISEYMDIKKKVSLTKKDFATFICLGVRKESKKQPCRSYRSKQHNLEHDGGLYSSIEPNNDDSAQRINNRKRRRKLEYEEGGCSSLSSGDNSPSEGKSVGSINGKDRPLNKYIREIKKMRQMPQSTGACGQSKMAASAVLRSKGENESDKDPRKSCGSKSHVKIRSKNRVLCSPETRLVGEGKILSNNESADHQERSEENDNSGASKYPMRVQKHKRQYTYPDIPQLRRLRLPWTTAEEEKLKEGIRKYWKPNEVVPWKKILEFGSAVFQDGRSTIDLKDKWRNLCRGSPVSPVS